MRNIGELRFLKVFVNVVCWFFRNLKRMIKYVIKATPGMKEGLAKWSQTLLFYTMLGALVLIVSILPLPLWGKAISVLTCALLLSFTTVVRTRMAISEKDVRILQN